MASIQEYLHVKNIKVCKVGMHAGRGKQHEVRLDGTFKITVSVLPYSMFRNVSSVATKPNPCNTTKN